MTQKAGNTIIRGEAGAHRLGYGCREMVVLHHRLHCGTDRKR